MTRFLFLPLFFVLFSSELAFGGSASTKMAATHQEISLNVILKISGDYPIKEVKDLRYIEHHEFGSCIKATVSKHQAVYITGKELSDQTLIELKIAEIMKLAAKKRVTICLTWKELNKELNSPFAEVPHCGGLHSLDSVE